MVDAWARVILRHQEVRKCLAQSVGAWDGHRNQPSTSRDEGLSSGQQSKFICDWVITHRVNAHESVLT